MANPFPYFKRPTTAPEAQSNVNYWWFEAMGGAPDDANPAAWNTYMREMQRAARADLDKIKRATAAPAA